LVSFLQDVKIRSSIAVDSNIDFIRIVLMTNLKGYFGF